MREPGRPTGAGLREKVKKRSNPDRSGHNRATGNERMVGSDMLYCDTRACSEAEAVEKAARIMRLDPNDLIIRSVTEEKDELKVRVEATISRGKEATEILETVLASLKIKAEVFFIDSYDRILINITGPHLGLIIGKGGATLEAIETLISAIHNRGYSMYKPVVVNPGGYRENKAKALKNMVRKACQAAECGDRISLPIMKQRDRKQVHQIIKEFPGYRSRSFGEGKDRRVYVYMESEEEPESEIRELDTRDLPPDFITSGDDGRRSATMQP